MRFWIEIHSNNVSKNIFDENALFRVVAKRIVFLPLNPSPDFSTYAFDGFIEITYSVVIFCIYSIGIPTQWDTY